MKTEDTLTGKRSIGLIISLHLAGWVLFSCLPVLFGFHSNSFDWYGLKRFFTHLPLLLFFFYLNYFVLIPRLFTTGKNWWYALSVLVSLILLGYFFELEDQLVNIEMPPERLAMMRSRGPRPFRYISFFGVFNGMIAFAISTSVRITNEWIKKEKERKDLENQKLQAELSFLKSQVNPHFLFNTLNNIYALTLTKSERAPESIMKLSQLLRYMLYETDDKSVALDNEIAHIEDYISLQRMRLTDQVKVTIEKNGNLNGKHIVPLLLIPFVENAFKHGIHAKYNSFINIIVKVEGEQLIFKVVNSVIPNAADVPKDKNSGIGLSNVAKRLELLYPGRHQLTIDAGEKEYVVLLQIDLV